MKTYPLVAAAILGAMAALPPAPAQDLRTQELVATSKAQVAEHLAATNQACGTHITMDVNYDSFSDVLTAPENTNRQAPWTFIVNVTDALNSLCGTLDGKAAVQARLTNVRVKHARWEAETMNGTSFYYAVPYTGATVQTIVLYLQGKL